MHMHIECLLVCVATHSELSFQTCSFLDNAEPTFRSYISWIIEASKRKKPIPSDHYLRHLYFRFPVFVFVDLITSIIRGCATQLADLR